MTNRDIPSAEEQLKAVRAQHTAWRAGAKTDNDATPPLKITAHAPFPTEEEAWEAEADHKASLLLIELHEARDDLLKSTAAVKRVYSKLKRLVGISREMVCRVETVINDVEKEL